MQTAYKNRKGFTLVEVVIAMFILLIGMLALLNTAAVVIDNNLINVLRDESSSVAESEMNKLRNTPFNTLLQGPLCPACDSSCLPSNAYSSSTVTRIFKGISVNYNVTTIVCPKSNDNPPNTLAIQVNVQWTHKGRSYQHGVSSVVNNVL